MQTYEETLYGVCPPEHQGAGFRVVSGLLLFPCVGASAGAARETLAALCVIAAFRVVGLIWWPGDHNPKVNIQKENKNENK